MILNWLRKNEVPVYSLHSRRKLCYQKESDFHSRKSSLSLVTDKDFMFPFYSPTMQCLRTCTDFKRISKWWAREKSSQDLQICINIRTSETWNCVDLHHLSAELKPCIYFPNLSFLLPFPSFPLLYLSHFSSFVPLLFLLPTLLWTLFLIFSHLSFLMTSYSPFLSISAPFSTFLIYFCYFILFFFSFHFPYAFLLLLLLYSFVLF